LALLVAISECREAPLAAGWTPLKTGGRNKENKMAWDEGLQNPEQIARQRKLADVLRAQSMTQREPLIVGGNVMRQNVGGDILSGLFGNALSQEADRNETTYNTAADTALQGALKTVPSMTELKDTGTQMTGPWAPDTSGHVPGVAQSQVLRDPAVVQQDYNDWMSKNSNIPGIQGKVLEKSLSNVLEMPEKLLLQQQKAQSLLALKQANPQQYDAISKRLISMGYTPGSKEYNDEMHTQLILQYGTPEGKLAVTTDKSGLGTDFQGTVKDNMVRKLTPSVITAIGAIHTRYNTKEMNDALLQAAGGDTTKAAAMKQELIDQETKQILTMTGTPAPPPPNAVAEPTPASAPTQTPSALPYSLKVAPGTPPAGVAALAAGAAADYAANGNSSGTPAVQPGLAVKPPITAPVVDTVKLSGDIARTDAINKATGETIAAAQAALPKLQVLSDQVDKHIAEITKLPAINDVGTAKYALKKTITNRLGISTNAGNLEARLTQLKAEAMGPAYDTLRGTGSVATYEGEMAMSALNRANSATTPTEFLAAMKDFQSKLVDLVASTKRKASGQYVTGTPSSTSRKMYNPATGRIE
jgi:hypothetical protein